MDTVLMKTFEIRNLDEQRAWIALQVGKLEYADDVLIEERRNIHEKLDDFNTQLENLCPHTNTSIMPYRTEGGGMEHVRSYRYQVKKCDNCGKELGTRYEQDSWGEWS
jgi:hypothetical protein